ncbi:MAG: 1-deoxy-D-xylulose-5-phosphate reductoisomerase [Clostridia bacterium]|nr:1-deoxy-D-xylulose-5-phosphate reductoisomerase [Clostridia bacterium]
MEITLLGSTGSIGTQTLDIVRNNPESLSVGCLVAGSNAELLASHANEFKPKLVGIRDENKLSQLKTALNYNPEIVAGNDAAMLAAQKKTDMVICAIVGMAGLDSFLEALKSAKRVGLANKEALVCGGELVGQSNTELLPIDSEHSAIFQCLQSGKHSEVEKLIITASGGPFKDLPEDKFKSITPEMALKNPNWVMGQKITIDSATLMNKGLEVIEAVRLFNIPPEKIEVVVHKESIIHSMVEFTDGSVLAQLGNADMRIPIQYAISYPNRMGSRIVKRLDLTEIGSLHFEKPRYKSFPCLNLAFEALKKGGLALTALNAANEAAVELFLNKQIGFTDIPLLIEYSLNNFQDGELCRENIHRVHNESILKIKGDYKNIIHKC